MLAVSFYLIIGATVSLTFKKVSCQNSESVAKMASLVYERENCSTEGGEIIFLSLGFLEAGHSGKMGKTKKDTNARVAGRRKEIKERAAEQLYMDNISTGLNESNDSSKLDSSESLPTSLF